MKRRAIFVFIVMLAMSLTVFTACQKKEQITTVRLNEVVHSIFYAPQYVALEKGFFEEEGLKIELDVGQGADKTMTAVISGNADIGLMGTEAGIYVYNEGKENHAVAFAQAKFLICVTLNIINNAYFFGF